MIKVLIVDDSALVREAAKQILEQQPGIRVLDTAIDPIHAMERMAKEWPDVIVLDIQMPRMDGITFLRKIMAERPTPVVICSTLVGDGAQAGVDALAAGALSLITKPRAGVANFFEDESDSIVAAVRAAAQTNLARLHQIASQALRPAAPPVVKMIRPAGVSDGRIIALGASTGGTQALETVLTALPPDLPGIVIVQHMPIGFSKKFADRLNHDVRLELREAQNGQRVERGLALVAEAGKQMRLQKNGTGYTVEVIDGPVINRHKPSVDCLFGSVARAAGRNAIGVLMTGMGDDGALGMKEMFDAGAMTVAESEETCVVFGMPRAAVKRGGVREVLPLYRIAEKIRAWAS
ncbi:chemotaxis response regulator protein-glutamate methylesterase [Uliginosibacterium sp. 31-16]|uniref:protein-glutamate methylesterase/protein-glutamine glutaminase n=1 Tax=Uliginosibacterium sp. 31-16 TaxID=3068315 RepID=UPI00273ECC71|nr:chemotaxis response regulator protein-glutamate methylesterase [Uliginosibacterium sp. 31-16]MDP5238879.1 chemotaxis response regulator protein-glutamate methylesterase [Uliginosibacterium sp. 31-16]